MYGLDRQASKHSGAGVIVLNADCAFLTNLDLHVPGLTKSKTSKKKTSTKATI